MDSVSLTVTPASEANSAETSGLRVDGYDSLTQPITDIGATSGTIKFKWTPRHSAGDFDKFGTSVGRALIINAYNDASNNITLRTNGASELRLIINVTGVIGGTNWTATGVINAGTTHDIRVEYDGVSCYAYIDDTLRITASPIGGIDFGANVPTTAYWGVDNTNIRQSDATFAAPD